MTLVYSFDIDLVAMPKVYFDVYEAWLTVLKVLLQKRIPTNPVTTVPFGAVSL